MFSESLKESDITYRIIGTTARFKNRKTGDDLEILGPGKPIVTAGVGTDKYGKVAVYATTKEGDRLTVWYRTSDGKTGNRQLVNCNPGSVSVNEGKVYYSDPNGGDHQTFL